MTEISRLPGPMLDLWEWQFEGACRDVEETLFFHPEGAVVDRPRAVRRLGRALGGRAGSDSRPPGPARDLVSYPPQGVPSTLPSAGYVRTRA